MSELLITLIAALLAGIWVMRSYNARVNQGHQACAATLPGQL